MVPAEGIGDIIQPGMMKVGTTGMTDAFLKTLDKARRPALPLREGRKIVAERRFFGEGLPIATGPLPEICSHGSRSQISTLLQGEGKKWSLIPSVRAAPAAVNHGLKWSRIGPIAACLEMRARFTFQIGLRAVQCIRNVFHTG